MKDLLMLGLPVALFLVAVAILYRSYTTRVPYVVPAIPPPAGSAPPRQVTEPPRRGWRRLLWRVKKPFQWLWVLVRRIIKWASDRSGWLAGLVIALLWPKAQGWLFELNLPYYNGDKEAAAAQSPWLPLGNPLSKLAVTLMVCGIIVGLVWLIIRLLHKTMHTWAKNDFKPTFLNLSPEWQHTHFERYWFGYLFFFALIWLGAAILA